MNETRQIVRIFLASPSDLNDERTAVKEAAEELNKTSANPLGFHIEVLGWEDTMPGFGRPQGKINKDLEICDLFVGLMWKWWGSRPGPEGDQRFTSGFEEEFEITMERRRLSQGPEVFLFLKTSTPNFLVTRQTA